MPVELLVGVLSVGLLVNVGLLVWASRSDRISFRFPRRVHGTYAAARSKPVSEDASTLRRRALFVGDRGAAGSGSAGPPHVSRAPFSETLPPSLADFLSQAAPIASPAGGHGFVPSPAGADRELLLPAAGGGPTRSTRLPLTPLTTGSTESGMAVDSLTGLEGPAGWTRIVEIENARLLRYRRPVTVVMTEVEGLRHLAERVGDAPVERLLPVIADAFRREARASDWVARVGPSRFAVLLAETDEIQAINYVERIRIVCEPWLASAAVPLRLAVGWSAPTSSSDLEFAMRRAEERMHSDRRSPGKSAQQARPSATRPASTSPGRDSFEEGSTTGRNTVSPAETGRVVSGNQAEVTAPPGEETESTADTRERGPARPFERASSQDS